MKRWRKMSVSKKIFISFLAAFFAAFLLLVLVQIFFFGKYYAYLTAKSVMETADNFAGEYTNLKSDEEINDGIIKYSDNNLYVMVMGDGGNILHMVSYELCVLKDDGTEIKVTLDNASHSKQFQSMNLKEGDSVIVGYRELKNSDRADICIPERIEANGKAWETSPAPFEENENDFERHFVAGVVISAAYPKERDGFAMQRHEALSAARNWRFQNRDTAIPSEGAHYFYTDPEFGNQYIIVAKSVLKDEKNETVIAVSSMSAVSRAVGVARRMSHVWIFIAIFAGIIISLFLTRVVSKPILSISDVTRKMSRLDFSEKCKVTSEDEIGILAQNINVMSERLDKAIKSLKEANEKLRLDIEHEKLLEKQRKEFVAAVSHELKTPLAVIQAYTEGILDGISGENRTKYLNVILDETKRMDRLVLEMLENSRLEAGAQKLDIKKYDMTEFAKKVAKRFEKTIKDAEINFISEIPEEPVMRSFDLLWIDRVADNFMMNAIFHTERGGSIALRLSDGIFSVENSGKHIENDDMEKIWDKFYKIDKSRTRSGSGTGLGLSIAKNILNMHGAKYGVQNTETGVKFWFEL